MVGIFKWQSRSKWSVVVPSCNYLLVLSCIGFRSRGVSLELWRSLVKFHLLTPLRW